MLALEASGEGFEAARAAAVPLIRASAGPGLALVAALLFVNNVVLPQALYVRVGAGTALLPFVAVVLGILVALPLTAWAFGSVLDAALAPAARHSAGLEIVPRRSAIPAVFVSTAMLAGPTVTGLVFLFAGDYLESAGYSEGLRMLCLVVGWGLTALGPLHALVTIETLAIAPVVSAVEGLPPLIAVARAFRLVGTRVPHYGTGGAMRATAIVLALICPFVYGSAALLSALVPEAALRSALRVPLLADFGVALITTVPAACCLAFAIPVWCSSAVTAYFARRACVDGYDIEVLAAEVGMADGRA